MAGVSPTSPTPPTGAVSERLKALFVDAGVGGFPFFPIRVGGKDTMHILGIEGRVELRSSPLSYVLLEGAEVGLHKGGAVFVSRRIAELIQAARLTMEVEPAELGFSDLEELGRLP